VHLYPGSCEDPEHILKLGTDLFLGMLTRYRMMDGKPEMQQPSKAG
jgi:hypothetical protein